MTNAKTLSAPSQVDDIEIAKQVCNWTCRWQSWYKRMPHWMDDVKTKYVSDLMEYSTKWEPQLYFEHAMEILFALQEQGYRWSVMYDGTGYAFAAFKEPNKVISAWNETIQIAICLAAMQLVEVDE